MEVQSIKSFSKSKGYTQLAPSVRTNTNGYPFVTFIDPTKPKDQQAENIYFSKNAALSVTAGTAVTKEMLANYQIGVTNNAAGEKRIKLVSNSERINIEDLL